MSEPSGSIIMNKTIISKPRALRRIFSILFLASAAIAGFSAIAPSIAVSGSRGDAQAMSKIAPWVLDKTTGGKQAEYLVVLADQADFRGADALQTKQEKGRYVRDILWQKAQNTQGPLLKMLRERGIEYRSFYIVNMIWVKGDFDLAITLANRSDVARIEGNPQIRNFQDPFPVEKITSRLNSPEVVESGVNYIKAPLVWAAGFTGQGIVVAGADTGIRWTHVTLKNHYRGWNGVIANHNYNWHDSIHVANATCAADSPEPCDDHGHGSHTIGTAIGDDGGTNQVGVAPGAKWIGCRNMNGGVGSPATYLECMEFFLAPYPIGGTPAQGDPSKMPDITTNSWGCPASEGCSASSLQAGVEAQRAAGIMMVVAAGNGGAGGCSTVSDPPSFYEASYSIGALTTGTDTIASFSSRGPVTADGSNRLKPDISAPGTGTRSAWRTSDTTYNTISGTSMATPHVAGAVALLWSARPVLRHDIAKTRTVLNNAAFHINSASCSSSGTWPNNVFGYGRIDVKAAVDTLLLTGAVSRKTQGAAGTFDVPLPLSGEPGVECRSSGGNYTIVFTFDNTVVSGNASVTSGTGSISGSPAFSGNTMTVNLTGVADVQQITVTLQSVTDSMAQTLPDTPVSMNVLVGDSNGNKTVNASDIAQTKAQVGVAVTSANFREDANADGAITSSDVSLVKSRNGMSVP